MFSLLPVQFYYVRFIYLFIAVDITIFRDTIAFHFSLDYHVCLLIPLTKLFSQKVKLKTLRPLSFGMGSKSFFSLKAKSVCGG